MNEINLKKKSYEELSQCLIEKVCEIEAIKHELNQIKAERDTPQPLTIEELEQMEGEPVWVTLEDGSVARWGIIINSICGLGAICDGYTVYWFSDVCKPIAYRQKPKGE